MRRLAFIIPILLVGCATTDPAISVQTQEVKIPIAIPCKAKIPEVPVFNMNKIDPSQDIFEKTKALLADINLHLGYEAELLAALNSCVK